ncbi:hypothetical protein [Hansschlegelia beijingensis]|uniref:Precorrin-3B synthase n=1 Tax=Hansschlegelia beijingensis TaxID=1133344 RepID=A0A7W6CWI2_9HYPH|nr:hypothetical protein [Hansschlegelia beijingensis]MBB3972400.1 precorrin-3B synthase [Hansschlegelia beijingensis]
MADCPGVLHLAAMADGALARIRAPGGRLSAAQARATAGAAATLGSGVIDLTSRANLQIRGMPEGAGPALAARLSAADLFVEGPADRRRNILLDPFSGLDPEEVRDMRPITASLDEGLRSASWIGALSPKFSFVLDGGGRSAVAAISSDVSCRAAAQGTMIIAAGDVLVEAADDQSCVAALLAIAQTAAAAGPQTRTHDLDPRILTSALQAVPGVRQAPEPLATRELTPRLGLVPQRGSERVALSLPVPVGRLDVAMLEWLADVTALDGEGWLALAPWSAVVIFGMSHAVAEARLAQSVGRGFTPLGVAERLTVVACAGSGGCSRAREPAKELGREVLELAAAEPWRLPPAAVRVHLSGCPRGCAGAATADLLLLGAEESPGWSAHRAASPRAPGEPVDRRGAVSARDVFELLAHRGR